MIQQLLVSCEFMICSSFGIFDLYFGFGFWQGCDASVLLASTPGNQAERDAPINLSLPGDAFDAVTKAKTALEKICPGVVSCADILAIATRDLVRMVQQEEPPSCCTHLVEL